ncbi:MAG: M48 family metallopeptidase [Bacteroidales bacterium]
MGKRTLKFWLVATLLLSLYACGSVLITGRKQLLLFSDGELTSLSNQTYSQIMGTYRSSRNSAYQKVVNEVGVRLTSAVERYARANGLTSSLEGLRWRFDVLESSQVNAFCLPNGSILFYEGIMPLVNSADLVAVVMGHEIAHAVAKHGNERMSQEMVVGTVGQVISQFIGSADQKKQAIFELAFGLGSQLGVMLPYSRKHEYEADRLGLIFMAMAGYDINVAPGFWERMSQNKSGGQLPEFFSTHPSDANRVKKIREVLVEAAKYR